MVKRNTVIRGSENSVTSGRVGRSSTRVAAETANLRLKELVPQPKLSPTTTKVNNAKALKPSGAAARNKNGKVASVAIKNKQRNQTPATSPGKKSKIVKVATRRTGLLKKLVVKKEDSDKWIEPNYKDKVWLAKEMSRCQSCSKTFKIPAKASACITSHDLVRCYFCFKVCTTTADLFDHFRTSHVKQTGKRRAVGDTVMCPFCNESVSFKVVSCHVITRHNVAGSI